MTAESFAFALGALIERALDKGLDAADVRDCLAVAGMILDERRPRPAGVEEEAAF